MSDSWVRTLRTAIQVLVALLAAAPVMVPALGLSATAGVGATILAVSALSARLMAVPQVADLLSRLGIKK